MSAPVLVASVVPVSYTHLDVYKRQLLATVGVLLTALFTGTFIYFLFQWLDMGTVSYTHLDVYKRQC